MMKRFKTKKPVPLQDVLTNDFEAEITAFCREHYPRKYVDMAKREAIKRIQKEMKRGNGIQQSMDMVFDQMVHEIRVREKHEQRATESMFVIMICFILFVAIMVIGGIFNVISVN